MTWTTPNTYATNDVITASLFNTDLRDNLLHLSTHDHDGSAGGGNDELSGLDTIAFDDIGTPASNKLGRNGSDLYWGSTVLTTVGAASTVLDAATATVSLGSGNEVTGGAALVPLEHNLGAADTDMDTHTATPAASTGVTWAIAGGYFVGNTTTATASVTVRIKVDGSTKVTVTQSVYSDNSGHGTHHEGLSIDHQEDGLDSSSHTVKTTGSSTLHDVTTCHFGYAEVVST